MYYNIYLDDKTSFTADNYTVVCNNEANFISMIEEKGLPLYISFDAKLSQICAEWLVNYCIKNKKPLPRYDFHDSYLSAGVELAKSILETFNKHFDFTKK